MAKKVEQEVMLDVEYIGTNRWAQEVRKGVQYMWTEPNAVIPVPEELAEELVANHPAIYALHTPKTPEQIEAEAQTAIAAAKAIVDAEAALATEKAEALATLEAAKLAVEAADKAQFETSAALEEASKADEAGVAPKAKTIKPFADADAAAAEAVVAAHDAFAAAYARCVELDLVPAE